MSEPPPVPPVEKIQGKAAQEHNTDFVQALRHIKGIALIQATVE
jgi:hypothetical protein